MIGGRVTVGLNVDPLAKVEGTVDECVCTIESLQLVLTIECRNNR